eukprot:1159503-Pelagomonas_calceolata.AAC.1
MRHWQPLLTISKANSGLLGLYTSVKIAGANSDDVIGQEILNNSRCLWAGRAGGTIRVVHQRMALLQKVSLERALDTDESACACPCAQCLTRYQ